MPVSWHSKLSVSSATLMLVIMVPSTLLAVASDSRPASAANPCLMSGGSSLSARTYSSLAASSICPGSIFIALFYPSSERERERERKRKGDPGRERGKALLPFAPGKEFEREQPQPAREVRREQQHQAPLAETHQRLVGPAQEGVQPRGVVQRQAQHPEVRRQVQREQDARDPVHEKSPEAGMIARAQSGIHRNTPRIARTPSQASAAANAASSQSREAPRQPSHSASTARSPIGTCTTTASRNTE